MGYILVLPEDNLYSEPQMLPVREHNITVRSSQPAATDPTTQIDDCKDNNILLGVTEDICAKLMTKIRTK